MAITVESFTFDCADPDALAAWWAVASGGTVNPVVPGEFVLVAREGAPNLAFQHVPDPTPGKNKAHLDSAAWSGSARPRPAGTASVTSSSG
jgi:hypothetical protein